MIVSAGNRVSTFLKLLLVAAFISAGGMSLSADEFYLLPEVIGTADTPKLGSFVTRIHRDNGNSGGSVGGTDRNSLALPLNLPIRYPALIPADTVRGRLAEVLPGNFILVGSYCLYIPKTFREENRETVSFWLAVLKKIAGMGELPDGWLELAYRGAAYREEELAIGFSGTGFDILRGDDADTFIVSVPEQGSSGAGDTEGVRKKNREIHLTVTAYVRALEAERRLRAGEQFNRDDFTYVYTHRDGQKDLLASFPAEGEYTAVHAIQAGTIIEKSDIQKKEIVRSGERVTIVVKKHPIYMKLEGIAYGSGGVGDNIRVKPVRSNKSLYGSVMPNREVYIDEL